MVVRLNHESGGEEPRDDQVQARKLNGRRPWELAPLPDLHGEEIHGDANQPLRDWLATFQQIEESSATSTNDNTRRYQRLAREAARQFPDQLDDTLSTDPLIQALQEAVITLHRRGFGG